MTALRPRLRALLVGVGVVALVTIGAGGTLAASTTPTVYACFNVNGQVTMATIPQCKLAGGGQLVQINAAGVPGPQGPQGLPGATGATGPTGPTGPAAAAWTHYHVVTGTPLRLSPDSQNYQFALIQCLPAPYLPSMRIGYFSFNDPQPLQWREGPFGVATDLGGAPFDLSPAVNVAHVTTDATANGGSVHDWTFIVESADNASCDILVGVS
jgi:hypothetical protein